MKYPIIKIGPKTLNFLQIRPEPTVSELIRHFEILKANRDLAGVTNMNPSCNIVTQYTFDRFKI